MGVYVTGDCHGDWRNLICRMTGWCNSDELTKDDFVIVCGDFGIWHDENGYETSRLDELAAQKYTVLFVDGNHENFDRLYSDEFEVVDFHGGKAHKIRENIYHLMRGNVFELCGKKFFAFGGASSHDVRDGILKEEDFATRREFMAEIYKWDSEYKMFRIKGISWWDRELPTEEEMEYGKKKLAENGNEVDFIISHCCPQQIASVFSRGLYGHDKLTNYFDEIMEENKFTKWYFGHYHDDRVIMGKFIMHYDQVERVV